MGRVRETLHDVLRQTDAVLLALCVASTLYGMVLIASATSFRGTLKYVAVQGLGLLIGLALYLFLSSIDIFELAKKWKWLLGFNVGFLLLLLTPFGQTRGGVCAVEWSERAEDAFDGSTVRIDFRRSAQHDGWRVITITGVDGL